MTDADRAIDASANRAAEGLRTLEDALRFTLHRGDLTVLVHPNTGQELEDHRDRAIWLGPSETLDLSILKKS